MSPFMYKFLYVLFTYLLVKKLLKDDKQTEI
jgi:hypothetical protein